MKSQYSPRETWKDKPFTQEDVRFFSKGVEELSERFTEERAKGVPNYFLHPKYRSAYLLYFLPLQAAKFLTLFDVHPGALKAAIEHGNRQGVLRVGDLGSGPGTASIATLLWLMKWAEAEKQDLPPIELVWFDTNPTTMEDGKKLCMQLADGFPRLRGKVTIITHAAPWWEVAHRCESQQFSLLLLGHVLNEAQGPQPSETDEGRQEKWMRLWETVCDMAKGGGALVVEPASRRTAQILSSLRDQLLQSSLLESTPASLWGPCLHAGRCPLGEGRDWCHFSFPTQIPGKWFREFSKHLGSERLWLKLSYLWIASPEAPAPLPLPSERRVISDPLGAEKNEVLLCEPERTVHHRIRPKSKIFRGDKIRV